MNTMKKLLAVTAATTMLFASSITVMATEYSSPAEIAAELTGQTVEDIIREHHDTGIAYCDIADAAGKLAEFNQSCLTYKEDVLQGYVDDGLLTQEEADAILSMIGTHMASLCDGSLHHGVPCNGTICNNAGSSYCAPSTPPAQSGTTRSHGHHGGRHGGRHHR